LGQLPDQEESEEGYCNQRERQQQAESAAGPLLRGVNWSKGEVVCWQRRGLLLRLFGAPQGIVD